MNKILDHKKIQQKMVRISHQILEHCTEEKRVYVAGICGNGYYLAQELVLLLRANSTQEFEVFEITLNKANPLSQAIEISMDGKFLDQAFVVLIDDVVNSGQTMQYGLTPLLQQQTKAIKTVALVDRKHRRYPVKCDFVGLTLSTTLKERIEVSIENKEISAFLV